MPKYAREDGRDIMTELNENLAECRTRLLSDKVLWQYKVCVHQQLDTTDNQIWELINSLHRDENDKDDLNDDDEDSGSDSIRLTIFVTLISAAMIFSLIFETFLHM